MDVYSLVIGGVAFEHGGISYDEDKSGAAASIMEMVFFWRRFSDHQHNH
jgi:hypothetical protein